MASLTIKTEEKINKAEVRCIDNIKTVLNSDVSNHLKIEAVRRHCSKYTTDKFVLLSPERTDSGDPYFDRQVGNALRKGKQK